MSNRSWISTYFKFCSKSNSFLALAEAGQNVKKQSCRLF